MALSPLRKALVGLGLVGLVIVGAMYGITSVPFGMIFIAIALVVTFPGMQKPAEAWDVSGVVDRKPKKDPKKPPKSCCG